MILVSAQEKPGAGICLVAEPNIFVIQNPDIYRCIRSKIDKLGFFYAEISDLFWDSVCRIGTEAHLKCDSSAI